jgi:hypothetical protein
LQCIGGSAAWINGRAGRSSASNITGLVGMMVEVLAGFPLR